MNSRGLWWWYVECPVDIVVLTFDVSICDTWLQEQSFLLGRENVRVFSQMDFCVSCALIIRYEGRVYMSHGRWLSLPGRHDTVDIDDGPSIDPWTWWSKWSWWMLGVWLEDLIVDLITIWWRILSWFSSSLGGFMKGWSVTDHLDWLTSLSHTWCLEQIFGVSLDRL